MHIPSTLAKNALGPLTDPGLLTPLSPMNKSFLGALWGPKDMMAPSWALGAWSGCRRGSRVSVRGGRQGIDDLIWDGDERFLTYANTDLQLFKMFIAILCLNGAEQPFKDTSVPSFCH